MCPNDEDDLSSGKVPFNRKQLDQTHSGTDETEDGDFATAGNFTFITHNSACIKLNQN